MKSIGLIFSGGLIIGIVLTVLFKERDSTKDEREVGGSDRVSVHFNESSMAGTRDSRRNRYQSFSVSSGEIGIDNLLDYLKEMSQKRNSGDPNFLELVRHGAMIGELDANGVQNLIAQLDAMVAEDSQFEDLAEFAAGIAFMRWCEVDGPAALAELVVTKSNLMKKEADDFAKVGIQAWTAADPEGARVWVEKEVRELDQLLQDGKKPTELESVLDQEELYKIFLEEYVEVRGQDALEIFQDVQNEEIKSKLRDNVIESLAEREDSVAELQNLLSQTEPGELNSRREVIRKLAVKANTESRFWVEQQVPTKERDHLVTLVAEEYLKSDLPAAADWYLKQELVGETRHQDRYSRIFGVWRQKDLAAAYSWLMLQPDTPSRDTAESLAANSAVGQKDYLSAVEWVSGIQNEGLKQQAFDRIIKNAKRQEEGGLPEGMLEAAKEAGFEARE